MKILVPVRYPLGKNSKKTLKRGIEISEETENSRLIILHINLFQNGRNVSRKDLRHEVEDEFGKLSNATYIVRKGFMIEESILEEAARQEVDTIVLGKNKRGRWKRAIRKMIGNDPDIEKFLRTKLDADIKIIS